MKKYELLKDLPDLKAGAIFEEDGSYIYNNEGNYSYLPEDVENNPEWFREVKEVKKGRSETAQKIVKSCNVYYDFDNDLVVRLGRVAEHIESNYIEKDKIREILNAKMHEGSTDRERYVWVINKLEELIK